GSGNRSALLAEAGPSGHGTARASPGGRGLPPQPPARCGTSGRRKARVRFVGGHPFLKPPREPLAPNNRENQTLGVQGPSRRPPPLAPPSRSPVARPCPAARHVARRLPALVRPPASAMGDPASGRGQVSHSTSSESGPRNVVLGWNRSACPGTRRRPGRRAL